MRVIHIEIADELHKAVRILAAELDTTIRQATINALEVYVEAHKEKE